MKPVEFEDGAVEIDASVIAEGLGIALPLLRQQMRARARSPASPSAALMTTSAVIA